jgi:hypothetical protein
MRSLSVFNIEGDRTSLRKELPNPQRDMTDHLDTLHKVDFEDNIQAIKHIRMLKNELLQGKQIT